MIDNIYKAKALNLIVTGLMFFFSEKESEKSVKNLFVSLHEAFPT